jgi:hypothetical protein
MSNMEVDNSVANVEMSVNIDTDTEPDAKRARIESVTHEDNLKTTQTVDSVTAIKHNDIKQVPTVQTFLYFE